MIIAFDTLPTWCCKGTLWLGGNSVWSDLVCKSSSGWPEWVLEILVVGALDVSKGTVDSDCAGACVTVYGWLGRHCSNWLDAEYLV